MAREGLEGRDKIDDHRMILRPHALHLISFVSGADFSIARSGESNALAALKGGGVGHLIHNGVPYTRLVFMGIG